ncbi:MAG: hypothetical protein PWP39_129 [Pyrococcus sp.]|nr:hypothetical protein [Pyrococcus sp.]
MKVGVSIYPHFLNERKTLASILADIKVKNYDFVQIFPTLWELLKTEP